MTQKIQDFLFRVYRIIGRTLIKHSSNPRPASNPYITGDGFRNFADHVYDALKMDFDPTLVKERDVVFVGDSLIRRFISEKHPHIEAKYILITHNGDAPVDDEVVDLVDDKIIKWYGINMLTRHPKAVPLPLGIENKHFYLCGIPSVFRSVIRKNYTKRNRIFYGFTVSTNPSERQPALEAMKRNPLAETIGSWRGFGPYLHLLAKYKFVASPPGSSVEGHRTWDALYIGIVPIVKSSITMDYFERLGVPLWKIKDWKELDGLNETNLEKKFSEIRANFDKSVLFLDYWTDKIRNAQD